MNILVGFMVIIIGFFLIISAYFFELPDEIYAILIVSGSVTVFVFGYWYARSLAEKYLSFEPIDNEIIVPLRPFQLLTLEKIILISSYAVYNLILFLIYLSDSPVPLDISFSGEASNFVPASEAVFVLGIMGIIWFTVGLTFVLIGLKKPIILHAGVLSKKWGRDIVFKIVVYSVMIQFITMDIILASLLVYQKAGLLLLSNIYFLILIVVFSYFPLFYAIYRRIKMGNGKLNSEK